MKIDKSPLLIVVIMIKNEALTIEKTLMPFVTNNIKHICVFDTGSTDNTLDVVQNFFAAHNIEGYIKQEPFIDFAASRNRALELAEEHFPHGHFIIMPDAEWYLQNPKALLSFLEKNKDKTDPLYMINLRNKNLEFAAARILRLAAKNRFHGVVHEVPETPGRIPVSPNIYFKWEPSTDGALRSKIRWERDAKLLLTEHEKHPTDARTAFYLAQTYDCMNEFNTALKYYKIRENLAGWDEENFITRLRIGTVLEKLSKQPDTEYTWEMALEYYLKAFGMRPHRIEPLIKIAEHYWPDNIPTCFLYSIYAYQMPYPANDLLFIEKEMYTYTRYEILSRCAWYMQAFQIGKDATKRALKIYPQTEHLKRNLQLYEKQSKI